jgi:hypothetical protein
MGSSLHVTDKRYLEKIKKVDLIPKSKDKVGSHPDKITII